MDLRFPFIQVVAVDTVNFYDQFELWWYLLETFICDVSWYFHDHAVAPVKELLVTAWPLRFVFSVLFPSPFSFDFVNEIMEIILRVHNVFFS